MLFETIKDFTLTPEITCKKVCGLVKAYGNDSKLIQQVYYKNTEERKRAIRTLKSNWKTSIAYIQICPGLKKKIPVDTGQLLT